MTFETPETNQEYIEKIRVDLQLLVDLIQSLHDDQIQMPAWRTYSETVIIKLCFHVSSMFQLFHGTTLAFELRKKRITVFDEPSIYSLFRTITENYLTFYYLFVDSVSDEEKLYRFNIFEYCGLLQRQSFVVTKEEHKKKQMDEFEYLEKIKTQIESSSSFQSLDRETKKKILKGIKPRLKNWKELMEVANISFGFNSSLYGFKSSYSHSEYLALLQIKSGQYGYNPNAREHFILFLVHMLICRSIINVTQIFPTIKTHYNQINSTRRSQIESLSTMLGQQME